MATANKHRKGENPARWKDHLDNLLAAPGKVRAVKHQSSLPYASMPAFMAELRGRSGMAALALEFMVLTCVRSADTRKAKHADVDRGAKIWTIPALSKTGAPHMVPLSSAALAAFDKARAVAKEIGGKVGRANSPFLTMLPARG
jgi:integrase